MLRISVVQQWTCRARRLLAGRLIPTGVPLALSLVALLAVAACAAVATSSESAPASPGVANPTTAAPAATSVPQPSETPLQSPAEPATTVPGPGLDLSTVPELDTSIAGVPLEEIVFDTFGRTRARFVPLSEATDQLILELRDVIAPIYQPVYGEPTELPWLGNGDLIIGYVAGGEAYAYPINVLNLHELVNDEIEGVPLLISYCPLCASGVVYHRVLNGQTLLFGNTSALYQSDLVMYDHQTGSYWFQTAGEAVVGPMTGSRLKLLPSTTMTWGEWKGLYPHTRLITGTASSPTQFASRGYGRDSFSGYQERVNDDKFAFPVDEDKLDDRLPSGELVLTVEVGDDLTAYPLERLGDAAVNDQVGEEPVVVFSRDKGRSSAAFSPVVDGRTLNFYYNAGDSSFTDRETGSVWDAAGRATSGPLAGTQLERLNTRRAFWFSIVIAFPTVNLYLP